MKTCDERLPSVCKKPGNLEEQKSGLGDKGCSEVRETEPTYQPVSRLHLGPRSVSFVFPVSP